MTSSWDAIKLINAGQEVSCPVCGQTIRTVPVAWSPGKPLHGAECPTDQRHFLVHIDDASAMKEMRARMMSRRDRGSTEAQSAGRVWRQHPFILGHRYSAVTSFQSFPGSTFIEGHSYELLGVSYSRYDGCTVFTFGGDGEAPIHWWWSDDEPEALCSDRFLEVE